MYEQLKLDNQICFRLYTISRLMTAAYRPLLEPLGLTYPQYLVMLVLWENDHQTVSSLVQRLGLETNTLTPLLQRMEREGLVVRTRGITDGRQTIISLSRQGKHLEERAKEIPNCLTAGMTSDLITVDDIVKFQSTLDRLIYMLKR